MNDPVKFPISLAGNANIAVGKSATIYTDSFRFGDVNDFALFYIQTATGIPNIKIEMQQSLFPPTTENAADANFCTPKSIGNIETTLTSTAMQGMQLTPITAAYIRFKITEQTDSVTDTVVNMWLSLQKKFQM